LDTCDLPVSGCVMEAGPITLPGVHNWAIARVLAESPRALTGVLIAAGDLAGAALLRDCGRPWIRGR